MIQVSFQGTVVITSCKSGFTVSQIELKGFTQSFSKSVKSFFSKDKIPSKRPFHFKSSGVFFIILSISSILGKIFFKISAFKKKIISFLSLSTLFL